MSFNFDKILNNVVSYYKTTEEYARLQVMNLNEHYVVDVSDLSSLDEYGIKRAIFEIHELYDGKYMLFSSELYTTTKFLTFIFEIYYNADMKVHINEIDNETKNLPIYFNFIFNYDINVDLSGLIYGDYEYTLVESYFETFIELGINHLTKIWLISLNTNDSIMDIFENLVYRLSKVDENRIAKEVEISCTEFYRLDGENQFYNNLYCYLKDMKFDYVEIIHLRIPPLSLYDKELKELFVKLSEFCKIKGINE